MEKATVIFKNEDESKSIILNITYNKKAGDINVQLKAEPREKIKDVFATKEQAEASVALAQLSQLREVYRNGWVPDWNDQEQIKHCFESSLFICFQDGETYDLFYNNFKDLIEKAKPLMQ